MNYAAVILAGGAARRLGGASKATLELDGRTLLDLTLGSVRHAGEIVVVGDEMPGVDVSGVGVRFVREDPPFGGPAAALLAGLAALSGTSSQQVVVLAVDMPRVTADTVERLLAMASGDGSVLVGPDGRRQLAMVLDPAQVVAGAPAQVTGLALRTLLAALNLVEVPAKDAEHRDVDTWEDLRELGG